ncbi:MAG: TlpA family protein disulfide reductase [Acidobacteria bacterium]|nr:MAG: TlpA family protein disulfide reductase [Acidobacteriota bacterium]
MVVKSIVGLAFVFASVLSLACGSAAPAVEVTAAPEGAAIEISELVGQMRDMAWAEEVDAAQALIEQQRPHHDASSPAWLVAASWLGRGASFAERWDVAEQYAREAHDGSVALLDARALDAEGELPTALGAGIEVLGHVLDAAGDRTGAVGFLAAQRERYRGTSIETRIQKNALLLGLEGQPFPVLDVEHYLGAPLPSADSLKGKVVVAFFWAHWCPDCKRQLPILEQLHATYGDRGLAIVGPTQLYGYVARGQDATPEEELEFLRGAYQERYPIPSWMSVPVSQQNFLDFGVSTTPTLVIIDREGIVRLYNPGDLPYEELSAQIERLLAA